MLLRAWRNAHTRTRWFLRAPIKLGLFLLVVAAMLWPYPALFPTWLHRMRNMNTLIDPSHPGLAPFEADVRARLAPDAGPQAALAVAESVVYARLPYAWDWDTWGVFDYWPTVEEALRLGREDCDGRAVVAASLLRRLGYEAELVTDTLHVWVETPQGTTMSPTSTERTLVSSDSGTTVSVTPGLIQNLARGLAYGVGAFPLRREIVIVGALALLTLHPWSSGWRRMVGCIMLGAALVAMRFAGINAALDGGTRDFALICGGVVLLVVGWIVLAIRVGGGRPRSTAAQPV